MTRSRQTADWGSRAGLAKIVPSSVAVGSGTGSADATGNVTVSGVSSVSLNDVFSSTYDRYKLMIRVTSGTATSQLRFRFRVSGADDSSNAYRLAGFYAGLESSSSGFVTNTVSTSWQVGYYLNGAYPCYSILDINQPNQALQKNIIGHDLHNEGQWYGTSILSVFTNSTSFTGLTIYGTSGNFTGTINIYGYTN